MLGLIGWQADEICKQIEKTCSETSFIKLPRLEILHEAVQAHADMLCFTLGNNMVIEPTLFDTLSKTLQNQKSKLEFEVLDGHRARLVAQDTLLEDSINVFRGATPLKEKYPGNIAYNVALIGKYALHNTKYTDPVVKSLLKETGYECIHTKQGYTNCMCLMIDEGALVTSDAGIAKTLRGLGLKVLLIQQGHIDLPGMTYGFIGGASFKIGTCVYFVGDIMTHPQGQDVIDFIISRKHTYKCIGKTRLLDIGSLRLLQGD